MELEINCPNCGMDNAFFNGICYECPDCDFTWNEGSIEEEEEELD
ncbi:MAG: hypothetical protein SFY32_14380 [Bacteroidota bacterium]|nr:hypothetical protein [Bacteroidota bacterium]